MFSTGRLWVIGVLGSIALIGAVTHEASAQLTFIKAIGQGSIGYSQLIRFDTAGNLWVADFNEQDAHEFSSAGTLVQSVTAFGPCAGVATDSSNNVYTTSAWTAVAKYTSSGTLLSNFTPSANQIIRDSHLFQDVEIGDCP